MGQILLLLPLDSIFLHSPSDSPSTNIGFDISPLSIRFSFYYHWIRYFSTLHQILLLLPLDSPSTTIGFSFYKERGEISNPMIVEGESDGEWKNIESNGSRRRI
jgi:hypothetical protein